MSLVSIFSSNSQRDNKEAYFLSHWTVLFILTWRALKHFLSPRFKKAVCCDDHEHCCPTGAVCNLATLTCDGPRGSTPMERKAPAFSTAAPAVAPTQSRGEPEEEEAKEARETDEEENNEEEPIQCDAHTSCPRSTTCCYMSSSHQWGCCPLPQVSGDLQWPPSTSYFCIILKFVNLKRRNGKTVWTIWKYLTLTPPPPTGGVLLRWGPLLPRQLPVRRQEAHVHQRGSGDTLVHQAPGPHRRPGRSRLCGVRRGAESMPRADHLLPPAVGRVGLLPDPKCERWVLGFAENKAVSLPLTALRLQAVCCPDKEHCCPPGYTCNTASNSCQKLILLQLETVPLTRVYLPERRPALGPSEPRDAPCDELIGCPEGNTCCRTSASSWGCCPSPNVWYAGHCLTTWEYIQILFLAES